MEYYYTAVKLSGGKHLWLTPLCHNLTNEKNHEIKITSCPSFPVTRLVSAEASISRGGASEDGDPDAATKGASSSRAGVSSAS